MRALADIPQRYRGLVHYVPITYEPEFVRKLRSHPVRLKGILYRRYEKDRGSLVELGTS